MPYLYYDSAITFMLLIVGAAIVFYAQIKISSNYSKYKKISNSIKLSGQEIARIILDNNNLSNVHIVETSGNLSDHYDPSRKVIKLSKEIFNGETIAASAVAAHEVGHAIQDKEGYIFMRIRSVLVPFVNIVNYLGYFVIIIGVLAGLTGYLLMGILIILITLIFQLITLPVEFDASKRALEELKKIGNYDEGTDVMLRAAAFTYVASVISSLLNLLRLIIIFNKED